MTSARDEPDEEWTDTHRPGGRTVQLRWTLGVTHEGLEIQALCVVTHRRAPVRAFVAHLWTVDRRARRCAAGHVHFYDSREGRPGPWHALKIDTPRFSRRGLEQAKAAALEVLRGRADDPQVARYFDVNNHREVQA